MDSRTELINYLKQHGASTIPTLIKTLKLSENAVRHHLSSLQTEGFISVSSKRQGLGRPAKLYALTVAAEGLFPKRYEELLTVILEEAQAKDLLEPILNAVVKRFIKDLGETRSSQTPEERLMALLEKLDYGEMLGQLEPTPFGWELKAYNCVYKDAGCKVEAVCDLLPKVISQATGLDAERPHCQRDGMRACTFTIAKNS